MVPYLVITPFIVKDTATLLLGCRLRFSRPDDTPSRATFSSWGLVKLTLRLCHADLSAGIEPDTDFTLYVTNHISGRYGEGVFIGCQLTNGLFRYKFKIAQLSMPVLTIESNSVPSCRPSYIITILLFTSFNLAFLRLILQPPPPLLNMHSSSIQNLIHIELLLCDA